MREDMSAKLATYLRAIMKTGSLQDAQREARLALRVMGIDQEKEG